MPLIYRGMRPAVAGPGPLLADNNANALGVRVTQPPQVSDVVTYLQAEVPWVNPIAPNGDPQGISVAFLSGCNLPSHRRPQGAPWNGTGAGGLAMWQLDTATLTPAQLACVAAPLPGQPQHAVVSPGQAMTLANYRGYIAATAANWVVALAPDPACAAAGLMSEGPDAMEPQLSQLSDHVATGGDSTDLVTALVDANTGGLSSTAIISGVEAAVRRAEESGNDEGAEALRAVLDRITGYCSPADRIELR